MSRGWLKKHRLVLAGIELELEPHVPPGRGAHAQPTMSFSLLAGALPMMTSWLARSLRRRETRTIGLIVPDNSNPFFADVARAIEDAGFADGYSVILCNSDRSETKESAYVDVLLAKQVDGLILISSSDRLSRLPHILAAHVPVVVVGRDLGDRPVSQVLVDNEQGGYLAGRYLVELGHRRIACIAGPSDATASWGRIVGFQRALEEAGLRLAPEAIVRGDFRYSGGEAAIRELLARDAAITAVFAANDLMAIGALSALLRMGHSVPGDVSVIGFDNILQASAIVPALTTVAQPIVEIGRVSVRLLLDQIAERETRPARVVLPATLIERESCRPIARAEQASPPGLE